MAHVTCVSGQGRNAAGKGIYRIYRILIPGIFILFTFCPSGFALHAARRALQFAVAGRIECGSRNEAGCVGLAQGEGEQKPPN